MKRIVLRTLIVLSALMAFAPLRADSLPTAEQALKNCYAILNPDVNSLHAIYRSTTVILADDGSSVTQVENQEVWRKKPNLFKFITDIDGVGRTVISDGKYMYISNESGKYDVVRGSGDMGTLAQVPFNVADFDSATLTANGDKYLVVLSGGKIKAAVDRLEVTINPSNWTFETMVGYGSQGETAFDGKVLYFDNLAQGMKEMDVTIDNGIHKTTTKLEVLSNEPNANFGSDVFAVVQ